MNNASNHKEQTILHELSGLKKAMTPTVKAAPIYATYTQEGIVRERMFDFANHDSRTAFQRFVSWACGAKIGFAVTYESTK